MCDIYGKQSPFKSKCARTQAQSQVVIWETLGLFLQPFLAQQWAMKGCINNLYQKEINAQSLFRHLLYQCIYNGAA